MLPEKLHWITEAFEPEGDPYLLARIAADLAAEGNLAGAATVYDRALGVAPEIEKIRTARAEVLDRLETKDRGLVYRYVPGGPSLMGTRDGEADEGPLHPVWLSPFWITQTPLSLADYCRLHGHRVGSGEPRDYNSILSRQYAASPNEEDARARYDLKPCLGVGWHEAQGLGKKLSGNGVTYALPSEAQWEKAARGGLIGARYPWGDDPPTQELCDFDNLYGWQLGQMRSRPANGYGLFAMSGCVWEWTADWYDSEYYRESPSHDPRGPARGKEYVLRGGSWADSAAVVTATYRMSQGSSPWREEPDGIVRTPTIGFRLCRTAG